MYEVFLMELHSHFVLWTCLVLPLFLNHCYLGYPLNKWGGCVCVCVTKVLRTLTFKSCCLVNLVLLPWGRWHCFCSWTPGTSTLLHFSSHSVPIDNHLKVLSFTRCLPGMHIALIKNAGENSSTDSQILVSSSNYMRLICTTNTGSLIR